MGKFFKTMRPLLIPNGPGQVPSSTRVSADEVFELDGTEPVDVAALLRAGVIIPWQRLDGKRVRPND